MKKILFALLLILPGLAFAGEPDDNGCRYKCTYVTEVTNVTNNYAIGPTADDVQSAVAMSSAVASLQFDFSDSALQVGIGAGTYRSENAAAIGVAKRVNDSLLLNASIAHDGNHEAGGVGATWKF